MRSRKVPRGAAQSPVPSSVVLWAAGEVRRSGRQLALSLEATGGIGTIVTIGGTVDAGSALRAEDRIRYPADIAVEPERFPAKWEPVRVKKCVKTRTGSPVPI
jgi:hypothetical protein